MEPKPLLDSKGNVRGYKVRYRTPAGEPKSKTFLGKGALGQARSFDTEVRSSKLSGRFVDPQAGRVTVAEFAERWRSVQLHRPRTAERVESVLRLHLYPLLGSRMIGSIRRSDLQAWVKHRSAAAAPSTVRSEWVWVRAVFNAAVTDRILAVSPCADVRLIGRRPDERITIPTLEQVERIAAALPARWRRMAALGAHTGLRPGELRGLTVGQVDFLRATLTVDRQGEGGPPKTDSSVRTIALAPVTVELLAAQLAEFGPGRDGHVFCTAGGSAYGESAMTAGWWRAVRRVGLEGVRMHDLRHLCASILLSAGWSVLAVQKHLGHASASETTDTYGHLMPEDDNRGRSIIQAAFASTDASRASWARPDREGAGL